ncbi:MAG TPA: hypothetical protein VEQ58_06375 [Polyangiaceae bacterium]|nr:hypothetical protein [Polyangiaceae bacterium]
MQSKVIFALAAVAGTTTAAGFGLLHGPARLAPSAAWVKASASASAPAPQVARSFRGPELSNRSAYIPAQCYAKTRATQGAAHNGCFVCHQDSRAPNYVDDGDVQTELSFADYATHNRWQNAIEPPAPAALGDDELLSWVRTSNYFGADGGLKLARALAKPPEAWDANHDEAWNGFLPDAWFHFDSEGFDSDPSGKKTGWRAYTSLPTPGMFMPTNGSAGDALIRLPLEYRQDAAGAEDSTVYRINLAIVEAFIRRVDVTIETTDERPLGSDLDGDGKLGIAKKVAFVWPAKKGRPFHYVGKAAELDAQKDGWPVAGSFPRGTEFLHSVRYLDVQDGKARMAPRMKELRYMRKQRFLNYGQLDQAAQAEAREKHKSPDKLKQIFANAERGVTTGVGWLMQGFIEDAHGDLRPQNVEETTACIGCHGGVGATTDATFTFARKLPPGSFRDGWYHPSERGLEGVAEPKRADGRGEYAHYLAQVGGADDFRTNDEAYAKFFRPDGKLDPRATAKLARDVSLLLMPSASRALALDRAYLGLVRAQRFEAGRDVTVGSAPQIELALTQDAPTGIETAVLPAWKVR